MPSTLLAIAVQGGNLTPAEAAGIPFTWDVILTLGVWSFMFYALGMLVGRFYERKFGDAGNKLRELNYRIDTLKVQQKDLDEAIKLVRSRPFTAADFSGLSLKLHDEIDKNSTLTAKVRRLEERNQELEHFLEHYRSIS